jgi:hypothetical protein
MPLRMRIPQNNIKSKSVSLEQEREYAEQTFKNMVWFYREELSKVHSGKTMEQIGLSKGEINNLKKQEILRLTATTKEKTPPFGKYRPGNGRIYVLTEKAKLALKEMAVSEN